MRIEAYTKNPSKLINAMLNKIENNELKTLEIVFNKYNEKLFNHIPEQWSNKALLMYAVGIDAVTFEICWWEKNDEPNEDIKGCIIGRFTELLMVHFKDDFKYLETH